MKKDNLIRSYVLTLILIILGLLTGQFLVQDTIRVNKNDAKLVNLAQSQATYAERIAKNAISMEYGDTENKFDNTKKLLRTSVDNFIRVHKALTRGDSRLGTGNLDNSDEIKALHKKSERYYIEIRDAALEMVNVNFGDNPRDKELIVKRGINNIFSNQRRFSPIARDIANQYEAEAGTKKTGFANAQYIMTAVIIGILLLQASFIFRPAVNLAYKNFLSANEAFVRLQRSEEELRKSAEKQLEFNEKLILSQRALEQRNQKLKLSEQQILKSSRKQIEVNEKEKINF